MPRSSFFDNCRPSGSDPRGWECNNAAADPDFTTRQNWKASLILSSLTRRCNERCTSLAPSRARKLRQPFWCLVAFRPGDGGWPRAFRRPSTQHLRIVGSIRGRPSSARGVRLRLARCGVPSATAAKPQATSVSSNGATVWALPLGHHLRALPRRHRGVHHLAAAGRLSRPEPAQAR